MAGNCKVRIDLDPAWAIDFTTEHGGERRSFVPSRPDHRTSLDDLLVDVHFAFRQACDRAVQEHLDVKLLELPKRAFGELRRKRRKHAGGSLHQNDAGSCRVDVPEILSKCKASQLGNRSSHFHPGRARPDDDERQRLLALFIGDGLFGDFEGQQHAPPDLEGILNAS